MLFLSASDIRSCFSCEEAMAAAESAMAIQERGEFSMPERLNMGCEGEGNILLAMPCRTESAIATKVVTVFPGNRKRGVPAINGLVLLNDPTTGEVLALLDGKTVTAIRTGAVTGVSVRYLAPSQAGCLGLVGCGVQAYDQVRHACAARPLQRVLLNSRSRESAEALRGRLLPELPGVEVTVAASVDQLMRESHILITATSARKPVLPDNPTLYEGKHCVAIGSFEPTVREYPQAIFSRTAKVWVDTPHASEESGELGIPLAKGWIEASQIETLGALIDSGESADRGAYGATFFKSVGMALFDLQAAQAIYEIARERGMGTELEI